MKANRWILKHDDNGEVEFAKQGPCGYTRLLTDAHLYRWEQAAIDDAEDDEIPHEVNVEITEVGG